MFIVSLLAGCIPYDGLDPETPRVQNERMRNCEGIASGELDLGDGWEFFYDIEQTWDRWGNLSDQRVESEDGVERETWEYRGEWLDKNTRRVPGSADYEFTQEWDGIFLTGWRDEQGNAVSVATIDSDGVHPYTEGEIDDGDDGSIDARYTWEWGEHGITRTDVDFGDDGSIDASSTIEYDDEGRVIEQVVENGDTTRTTWEWDGPHENLLHFREVTRRPNGSVRQEIELISDWSDDWTRSDDTILFDGDESESRVRRFDGDGRLLEMDRTFPGNVAPARERWTWDCPIPEE